MAEIQTVEQAHDALCALFATGEKVKLVRATINIDADAANGDVHRLVKGLPLAAKVLAIFLPKQAQVANLTDVDFGVYRSNEGAVIDADILIDGKDFGTAAVGVGDINSADGYKTLGELLSLQNDEDYPGGIDVAATINVQGAGTGTITLWILIA